jgi:hypothetical protein
VPAVPPVRWNRLLDSITPPLLVNGSLLQRLRIPARDEVASFSMGLKNLVSDSFNCRSQFIADTPQKLIFVSDSCPLQCPT